MGIGLVCITIVLLDRRSCYKNFAYFTNLLVPTMILLEWLLLIIGRSRSRPRWNHRSCACVSISYITHCNNSFNSGCVGPWWWSTMATIIVKEALDPAPTKPRIPWGPISTSAHLNDSVLNSELNACQGPTFSLAQAHIRWLCYRWC